MRHTGPALFACWCLLLAGLLPAACGDDGAAGGVTVQPRATNTQAAAIAKPTGGKPAAPTAAATADAPAATPTDEPPLASTEEPAPTSAPNTSTSVPNEGRWIEVDVTNFVVRLMDGGDVLDEFGPVAVGEAVDTGEYVSTQTGLFHVYNKIEELAYDAPYDTYISHWVGFDPDKDNGFHSFLKDASGAVVDASTGRVSNGCIRTGSPEMIFSFAEIGMPVWVHA